MAPTGVLGALTEAVGGNTGRAPSLEIRLETDQIFFRGPAGHTEPQTLRGELVVNTGATIRPKQMTITLHQSRYTSHCVSNGDRDRGFPMKAGVKLESRDRITVQSVELHDPQGKTISKISAGEHTFPFSVEIPGDIEESVEGTQNAYRKYEVAAQISLGTFTRDLKAKRRVRFVRTMSTDHSQYEEPQSVAGTWTDKIDYSVSTLYKANIFGGRLTTEFELTPLLEKMEIKRIQFDISETQRIRTDPGAQDYPVMNMECWKEEVNHICHQVHKVPEGSDDTNPNLHLPMKKFLLHFDMPKSLRSCRQSIPNDGWIQFWHRVHYKVYLKNPDGHYSELKIHHPILIFISPNNPMGDNDAISHTAQSHIAENQMGEILAHPPPYGEHALDLPVDPFSDLATAAPTPGMRSGANTPGRPSGLSPLTPTPEELALRLANVQSQGPRMGNNEETSATVEFVHQSDFDDQALARVPSYNTAVHTQGPSNSPGAAVPTYDEASRPPSPVAGPSTPRHQRNGGGSRAS